MNKLPHSIELESIPNSRELGGYVMQDGRIVKHGVLLRTGRLSGATASDIERLTKHYKLTKMIDLRFASESGAFPDPQLDGVQNMEISIIDSSLLPSDAGAITTVYTNETEDFAAFEKILNNPQLSQNMYMLLLSSKYTQLACKQFFDEVLNADGTVLWHCTSGKDRTGMTSVLILTALGADKATVLADFALTNEYNKEKIANALSSAKKFTDNERILSIISWLVGVNVSFMEDVFAKAEALYGSMLEYMKTELGVTDDEISRLRKKYLE